MKNIVLVGFMGTGKTSVGLSLAERLDMTFLDMDDMIVEREGRSIPEIFDKDGEEYFRALERTIVQELAGKDGLVVATGGGVVLNRDNVDDFERTGLLVCLSASPEVILARVEADTNRPLLEGDDKMAKITAILDKRQALYDSVACQIKTDELSCDEVVKAIIDKLG
jgi:shikimate kinase